MISFIVSNEHIQQKNSKKEKNTMKKRILSIALVVAMIVVMIPAMLLPTAAFDYVDGYRTARVGADAIDVDATAEPDAAYLNSEMIVSTLHYDNRNSSGETSSIVSGSVNFLS